MFKAITTTAVIAALAVGAVAVSAYALQESRDPQPQAEVSSPATPASTSTPTATAPAFVPPAVGQPVAAADVEAARAAGANVYVSPRGDGTGIVVDPAATIPQVVYDDLWATSLASPTDEQIASDEVDFTYGGMRSAVVEAVYAAHFELFVIYPLIHVNDPKNDGVTYRAGWGGGVMTTSKEESKALNEALRDFIVEGVPVGQARLDKSEAYSRSPESVLTTTEAFRAAHPLQVVILK